MNNLEQLRSQFLDLISAYSEDRYVAGWSGGIEKDIRAGNEGGLWIAIAAVTGWPLGYRAEEGWDVLTQDELAQLTEMTRSAIKEQYEERRTKLREDDVS